MFIETDSLQVSFSGDYPTRMSPISQGFLGYQFDFEDSARLSTTLGDLRTAVEIALVPSGTSGYYNFFIFTVEDGEQEEIFNVTTNGSHIKDISVSSAEMFTRAAMTSNPNIGETEIRLNFQRCKVRVILYVGGVRMTIVKDKTIADDLDD